MSLECSFLGIYKDQNDSFRGQLTAIATMSAILSLPTIILNFLLLFTVVIKKHLHHPAYMIIANLALTDWLAGCISFPCYAAICFTQSVGRNPCFIASVTTPIAYVLGIATFLIISCQAVERFIAIFYPFQYKTWVTNSAIIITSLIICLTSCSGVIFWVLSRNTLAFNIFIGVILLVFSPVNIFCHYKIYVQTRKIEKQISNQAKLSNGDKVHRPKSESKVARVTAVIMINVFVCYTPQLGFCLYDFFPIAKVPESYYFLYWAWILAMTNSFINPIITYRQLSVIRNAVFNKNRLFENSVSRIRP